MSFEGLLDSTCSIFRAATAIDDSAQQSIDSWTTIQTNVRCRVAAGNGTLVRTPAGDEFSCSHVIFLPSTATIGPATAPAIYRITCDSVNYRVLYVETLATGLGLRANVTIEVT